MYRHCIVRENGNSSRYNEEIYIQGGAGLKYALVATTGYLLLVDLESKQVTPLESHRPEYYGISWFAGGTELVLSHSGLDNTDLVDLSGYALSEQGWVSGGARSSKTVLSAPHQIICAPDARVICANTGRNVITVVDLEHTNTFQEAGISAARWDRLALDRIIGDHLNSVFLQDDKLFAIAHGHNKGSQLAIFSYPELELLSCESLGARTGLHNIWVTSEGQRISCHSEIGGLVDLASDSALWESGSSGYTRGLAASQDYVLVGESQKTIRDLRRSSLSGLWILDRQSWLAIDYLCLGPYGAVQEVRLLDVPDEAHHGHLFQGLDGLLQKSLLTEVANSKLKVAADMSEGKRLWADYAFIFGMPETQTDGARHASLADLCLMLKKPEADNVPLAFTYTLEQQPGAHVSAVVGYTGSGGDTQMAALLLYPQDEGAALSVWVHDGSAWASLPDIAVLGLPVSGSIRCMTSESEVVLFIDQREVLSLTATTLGLSRCNEGLGIRWIGASVKPIRDTALL
ncbi:hypothetical protein HX890_25910 [Pseudomonas gingeri]|uniref:hypothetical protein n=1 Tax=Pseudomonas gingeri TaxID=117681 RepID=UPI0015A45B50|nr:hypothetical protein [Pseudomonas gingeri]NWD77565.1 hypothetical protein [Pseudomonas gingeri]